ncbi:MAG: ABC transporter permease [Epsilonproteobacteria bacterium]|nr:ABC transporter permease [Campylobacterota bacterium]
MNNIYLIKTALHTLNHHKGRSLLTCLGIIIGTASIIAIMAIGKGAEEKIKRDILATGSNSIYISPGSFMAEGKVSAKTKSVIRKLKSSDTALLQKTVPEIAHISPFTYTSQQISYSGNTVKSLLKGSNEHALKINNNKIELGSFFLNYHVQKGSRVIVLGWQVARDLFGIQNPVGKTVQIGPHHYTVLGVLAKSTIDMSMNNPNYESFMPIKTVQKNFGRPNYIHGIALSAKSASLIPTAVKKIRQRLRTLHRLTRGMPDDFMIYDQLSMLQAAQKSSHTLSLLLIIIALISLIVGGIGIMNIMLASVSQRTKEIGIRMSLGATYSTILCQFLYEALVLCFIGGTIGIALGFSIPYLVKPFTGWLVIHTPSAIIIAAASMISVGVAFGYYPAQKAARMDPVKALIEQ